MKSPQDVFADYLAQKSLKMTPQRRLILETFLSDEGHLSSEELYNKVKATDPSIGQATVYRALKLLADSGLAEVVDFADGVARYEPHGQAHHDHLICEVCKKYIEIVDDVIEKRQDEVAEENGFKLLRHKMYLYGICSECQKKDS